MKLRVKSGCHIDASGKVYNRGDTFESPTDLRKVFREKFEKVSADDDEAPKATAPAKPPGGGQERPKTK